VFGSISMLDLRFMGWARQRRMVMRQDYRGGIVPERLLDDFARVDRCPVDRA
jgi:hypothetical protein